MKINTKHCFKGLILVAVLNVIFATTEKKFLETEGFASNLSNDKKVDAVNFALAKSNSEDIFGSSFRPPTLVERLPPKQAIETGGPEVVEEIPSTDNYYDGTKGMKITVTRCNIYETKPQACVNNNGCGWCQENNKCVEGNSAGPAAGSCLSGRYIFTAPDTNWNPLSPEAGPIKLERVNILGAQLSTFTQQGK
jgi:hypothetical protein